MNIALAVAGQYEAVTTEVTVNSSREKEASGKGKPKERDTVEFSAPVTEMRSETYGRGSAGNSSVNSRKDNAPDGFVEDKRVDSASSGDDKLKIFKGKSENTYIIRFYDSALVARTVQRGYITVNGTSITLPEDVKQRLMEKDKSVQEQRNKAFLDFISRWNAEVSRQQASAGADTAKKMAQAFQIASKIASGAKVAREDEQFLMEYDAKLYAMAKSIAMMAKQRKRQEEKRITEEEQKQKAEGEQYKDAGTAPGGLAYHEWNYYETTMEVSLGGEVSFGEMGSNELTLYTTAAG